MGLKILDLSRVLAGPLCAQSLGDLGAEVVKIETPVQGDDSRAWPPFYRGVSTAFITANRNKKSVAVNLKTPEGREILHKLAKDADVVIESAVTGVSQRLGADYETLSGINPSLIYCTISGFGRTGPLREMRGYDMILQAYGGIMSLVGDEGSPPIRVPFAPIDQTTAYHAVNGVLAALIERGRTGKGAYIEVSLYETAVSFISYQIQNYIAEKKLPKRIGSRHGGIAPYQAFKTADRPVLIGIANDKLWRSFCNDFGIQEMAKDPRFLTNADRVKNCDAVVEVVQSRVADIPSALLLPRLEAAGIPCAPINTVHDVLEHPQTVARGLVKPIDTSAASNEMMAVVLPILFNEDERDTGTPPPMLGEHSDIVLQSLGYSRAEIEALEAGEVIGRHKPDLETKRLA